MNELAIVANVRRYLYRLQNREAHNIEVCKRNRASMLQQAARFLMDGDEDEAKRELEKAAQEERVRLYHEGMRIILSEIQTNISKEALGE